jgi:hypothetical protein
MAVLTLTFPTVTAAAQNEAPVKFLDLIASGPSRFRQGDHHHSRREASPPRIAQAAAREVRALRAGARPDRRVDEPLLSAAIPLLAASATALCETVGIGIKPDQKLAGIGTNPLDRQSRLGRLS